MNRVTDVSEGLLISFYISGLKPTLQRELLVSKPTTLGEAFSLARITEARFADQLPTTLVANTRITHTSPFRVLCYFFPSRWNIHNIQKFNFF